MTKKEVKEILQRCDAIPDYNEDQKYTVSKYQAFTAIKYSISGKL